MTTRHVITVPPRPHQTAATGSAAQALTIHPGHAVPPQGLRTQARLATGSGKTLIGQMTTYQVGARRVIILVPSLDLLEQTADAWRRSGHHGPMFGLCSLASTPALRCTTDPTELVAWTANLPDAAVFATYASVGLGTLQEAHTLGLPAWDLAILDEAHRVSGAIGKPWAAVLDNTNIPATRRLSLTATPRMWELGGPGDRDALDDDDAPSIGGSGRSAVKLIASMDDPSQFGEVAYELPLRTAIDEGIIAPYRVVCVEITDAAYQEAVAAGETRDRVRSLRLAAMQAAMLKTAGDYRLERVLTFHSRVAEAKAFAEGLPQAQKDLAAADPSLPLPQSLVARWLYGEHSPEVRREGLANFHAGVTDAGTPVALSAMSSAKVLGVGVDTWADAVIMCDVFGAMPDIVQVLGRALRMQPGDGKIATIVVPVMLGPGESPDQMLTSPAYDPLARFLEALRSHDTQAVEALSASALEPAAPSSSTSGDHGDATASDTIDPDAEGPEPADEVADLVEAPGILQFATPRDPGMLARFISLRVLQAAQLSWRRGLESAIGYQAARGDLRVPYTYRDPVDQDDPDEGFPLGIWIAEQRRAYRAGRLAADRIAELTSLNMVWSEFDAGFEDGLTAAREWFAAHGHLLPANDAVTTDGYPIGRWLHNQRSAARLAASVPDAADLPPGALTRHRQEALEAIDPSWCPAWAVDWQRRFTLARVHVAAGGTVTGHETGQLVVEGEDIGRWATIQQNAATFEKLSIPQQWMLRSVLGIEPAAPSAPRTARLSNDEKWQLNIAAARQYHGREGHLNVPRRHTEPVDGHTVSLGVFVNNTRARRATLPEQRAAALDELGMRWS